MKKLVMMALCLGVLFGCSSNNKETSNVKAKNGDVVKIDYVGKLKGTAFQGGTAQGAFLELGSGTYIDGFEEQIVDMNVGSDKTIKVTFPDNYGASELAGKEVTFDIHLLAVYREEKGFTSANGDIVKIDYVGKKDGTPFSGGSASGYLLALGSDTFIEGFEDQLIGMKATDSKTIQLTFPENYNSSELAGKDVTFDVAVNHIYREVK